MGKKSSKKSGKKKGGKKGDDNEVHVEEPIKYNFNKLPKDFASVDDLVMPYVREIGIKACIEQLSAHFDCKDYKFNMIQFWFLDVITDCLWRLQDEFQFPERHQKTILKWVLYMFDLVRDPARRLTRKDFFKELAGALTLAEDAILAPGSELPPPPPPPAAEEMAEPVSGKKGEPAAKGPPSATSLTTYSSASSFTGADGDTYMAVKIDEANEYFKLPKPPCVWNNSYMREFPPEPSAAIDNNDEPKVLDEIKRTYKPNFGLPARFRRLPDERVVEDNFGKTNYLLRDPEGSANNNNTTEFCETSSETRNVRRDWFNFIEENQAGMELEQKIIFINKVAIMAIKHFAYNFFAESFQFTVISIALRSSHSTEPEQFNENWNVPKIMRVDIKKNIIKKYNKFLKKQKAAEKKRLKAEKKAAKKKAKAKKLSKKEKAELAKLKKLEAKRDEELRKIEEKKKSLWPLQEAVNAEFIKNVFENLEKAKLEEARALAEAKAKADADAKAEAQAQAEARVDAIAKLEAEIKALTQKPVKQK